MDTYLTGAYPALKRACAHLILTNTTSEVFFAFLVTQDWYVGHVEDSLISSPLKNRRRNTLSANVFRDGGKEKEGGQMLNTSGNRNAICCSAV